MYAIVNCNSCNFGQPVSKVQRGKTSIYFCSYNIPAESFNIVPGKDSQGINEVSLSSQKIEMV